MTAVLAGLLSLAVLLHLPTGPGAEASAHPEREVDLLLMMPWI